MEPTPLVMVIPSPAVRVARVNPAPLPISICPLDGVVVRPVPPFAIGRAPVTPVARGRPVALPKVIVGPLLRTTLPVPVLVVTPVPPDATGSVPEVRVVVPLA